MWSNCKKILCIRADNMGDLVMTTPALRALKETYNCHIAILTSRMACKIAEFIPFIDEVIVHDFPWVKSDNSNSIEELTLLAEKIRNRQYDAVVIFTVYSQSALPAALLTFMAGIPKRLAYCRENPYSLLTDWIPDKEPYSFIQHQVQRDLQLVGRIGAVTKDDHLYLQLPAEAIDSAFIKLKKIGIFKDDKFVIFHPGASEEKRKYPTFYWIELGRMLNSLSIPICLTGTLKEFDLAKEIADGIGDLAYNSTGLLDIGEFIAIVDAAAVVVSVNTATIHIAAARQTPIVALYALTNPQHTPWKVKARIFPFSIRQTLKSKNEVVTYVSDTFFKKEVPLPKPSEIIPSILELLETHADKLYISPNILLR